MSSLITGEKDLDSFMEKINDPAFFMIDQWELEMLVKARKKAEIYLYSGCLKKCGYQYSRKHPYKCGLGRRCYKEGT